MKPRWHVLIRTPAFETSAEVIMTTPPPPAYEARCVQAAAAEHLIISPFSTGKLEKRL